jgi:hypothetical protein
MRFELAVCHGPEVTATEDSGEKLARALLT